MDRTTRVVSEAPHVSTGHFTRRCGVVSEAGRGSGGMGEPNFMLSDRGNKSGETGDVSGKREAAMCSDDQSSGTACTFQRRTCDRAVGCGPTAALEEIVTDLHRAPHGARRIRIALIQKRFCAKYDGNGVNPRGRRLNAALDDVVRHTAQPPKTLAHLDHYSGVRG